MTSAIDAARRILALDKTGFTSDDTPWGWRDFERLDDCNGNWLLASHPGSLNCVDNVREIIGERGDSHLVSADSRIADLEESYQLSCKHNNKHPDDIGYFREYMFAIIAQISRQMDGTAN